MGLQCGPSHTKWTSPSQMSFELLSPICNFEFLKNLFVNNSNIFFLVLLVAFPRGLLLNT